MGDALGNPLKFIFFPGHQHDVKTASSLVEDIAGSNVLAKKTYDIDKFILVIEKIGENEAIQQRVIRKSW